MAEYLKFRLTAAKVGVTMALAALIAGAADAARSGEAQVQAKPAAFLKTGSLTGLIKKDILRLEDKCIAISRSLKGFEQKVYIKGEVNRLFLRKDGTAANANKLGNLSPGSFVLGNRTSVATGAGMLASGNSNPTQLVQVAGGIIAVLITGNADQAQLTVINKTGALLPAVQDTDGTGPISVSMGDGSVKLPTFKLSGGVGQVRLQVMPNGAFKDVVSVLVSLLPAGNGQIQAVAQAFTGGV